MLLYLSTEIDTEQKEKERKIIIIIKNKPRQEACGFCMYSSGFGSGHVKNTGNVLLCLVVKFSRTVCCILLMSSALDLLVGYFGLL